ALKGGKVERPWLGASVQPLTSDLAESLGLARPAGAMVTRVHPTGPAQGSGLQVGDVIVSFDGRDIQDPEALEYRFVTKGVGTTVELGLYRDGKRFRTTMLTVVPIEEPPRDARDLTGANPFAGSRVANLSPAVSAELGLDDDGGAGVVVMTVERRSNAGQLGLRTGDMIVGVNDQEIQSVEQLASILKRRSALWRLAIERGGKVFDLTVRG
ncbi:MAG: PDZ domain-containing protein, partial [Pseudomonadota bacterium]